MDPIGVSQIITASVPNLPAPSVSSSGQTPNIQLSDPNAGNSPVTNDQAAYNAAVAEQSRADAVQKASQQVANLYVLGDQEFTIFKDATGQYITRYTSLRDGKVTYIPEPSLFKLGGGASGSETAPVLNITA